jgi:hypothetical protein
MKRPFSLLAGLIVSLAIAGQTRAESTIEVNPQTLLPVAAASTANFALNFDRASIVTAQSQGNEGAITPVRRWGYGRSYYGGYYRPYRSYYGGGWGYPYRSYSYYRPYYNYGYSSYPYYGYSSYPSYNYGYYPRYTTGYRYGINPGVSFSFGW